MQKIVENTIVRIELERENVQQQAQDWADNAARLLFAGDNAADVLQASKTNVFGAALQILLHRPDNTYAHYQGVSGEETVLRESQIEVLQKNAAVWLEKNVGEDSFVIFVPQTDLDEIVKNTIHKQIHAASYGENKYIWVNEILDLNGGENYAIRRIHPNLIDSEGDYLSTNENDIMGNKPYLRELRGMQEKGELFQTYYFKNKSNDEIVEKLSYAKYYAPFQWIVATGTPMNDIFSYTNEQLYYDKAAMRTTTSLCFLGITVVFLSGLLILFLSHKKYSSTMQSYIGAKTERDPITGCLSREYAQAFIRRTEHKPERTREAYFLALMDLDDFKKTNDAYGHTVGDMVLRGAAESVSGAISEGDLLFYWGCGTFLLLCSEIPHGEQTLFGEKLISRVHGTAYQAEEKSFHVSISIGAADWDAHKSFSDALKEAECALCEAKRNGKNRFVRFSQNGGKEA